MVMIRGQQSKGEGGGKREGKEEKKRQWGTEMAIIAGNVFAFSFCNWATQPMLPYLAEQFGEGDEKIVFGYVQTLGSLFQFIGSPLMGMAMDKYGYKWGLLVSQLCATLSFAALSLVEFSGIWMLFLSRLPMIFMHSMASSQHAIAQTSPKSTRSEDLGKLALFYGLGILLGPFLGGIVSSRFGYWSIGCFSSLICLLSAGITLVGMKEGKGNGKEKGTDKKTDEEEEKLGIFEIMKNKPLRGVLLSSLFIGSGVSIMQVGMIFYVKSEIGFEQQQVGYLMSYVGFLAALMNVFGIKFLKTKLKMSESTILKACALTLSFTYIFLFPLITTPLTAFLVISPIALATSSLYTVSTSLVTLLSPSSSSGGVLGVNHGVRTVCRILGPVVAGYGIGGFGYGGVFGLCGGSCLAGFVLCVLCV